MCHHPFDIKPPLCNECWERLRNSNDSEDYDYDFNKLCEKCKDRVQRWCGCCDTVYEVEDNADVRDWACKYCREQYE